MKKIFIICALIFISIFNFSVPTPAHGHDFNIEAMTFMLANGDATWTEFEEYMLSIDDEEFKDGIQITENKIATALSLPGKKNVANYAFDNPDFTYFDIKEQIWDDPMLLEVWPEAIYSFLNTRLRGGEWYAITFDFFVQFIKVGFEHILWWADHILFLLTLIICLPKTRRILLLITTFTLAHSLTILLWWMNLVSISSFIVEWMILISILIMAVYAILQKVGKSLNVYAEVFLIFVLWLFHWLWFAGFFRSILDVSENMFFPIFAFNIWVELGQILVLIIALGLLHLVYKILPKQKENLKNIFAVLIIIYTVSLLPGLFG